MSEQRQVQPVHAASGGTAEGLTAAGVRHRLLVLGAALVAALVLAAGALAAGSPATPRFASEGEDDGPYTQHQAPSVADAASYSGP